MASGSGSTGGQANSCRFFSVLSSAISEWSLIIILLVNAVLAYLTTRIARLCKLPAPCMLCSRLDHVLGDERKGFYRNLFCHAHKVDISALVYCHGHKKLADFREMCEACLLSSAAAIKKPKAVLGANLEDGDDSRDHKLGGGDEDANNNVPPLNEDPKPASSGSTRLCSCCSEPFNLRGLLQVKVGGGVSNCRAQLRKRLEKPSDSTTTAQNYDLLSHAGYNELKISSDSDSEVPLFSGDDADEDGYAPAHVTKDIKEESSVLMRSRGPPSVTNILEDTVPERLIHPNPVVPEHSLSDLEGKSVLNEGKSSTTMSKVAVGRGLEDSNWSNADAKATSNLVELSGSTPERVRPFTIGGIDGVPATTNLEAGKVSSSGSITSQFATSVDRNESFKNALSKKGIMLSPRFSEIVAGKAQEDLKSWLSQKSFRALELPWSEVTCSPKVQAQWDDSSTSIGLQNIAKRLSVERNNSINLENFDINLLGDIEGETSLDRLKQQIELDRKSLSALYKELEEERNASAVAANEAMAMITRLQEEKAAMHMEALQYLRVMEEQYEYDQEAIQKLNDLLTEREKELLDLDAELENYRKQLGESVILEEKSTESRELNSACSTPRRVKLLARSKSERPPHMIPQECTDDHGVKDPSLGFEEEKAHISKCLKSLQQKFQLLSTNKASLDEATADSREEDQPDRACRSSTNAIENGVENGLMPASRKNSAEEHATTSCDPCKNRKCPPENGSSDMGSLQDEVSKLKERLYTLESDREFLLHAANALKYGSEGVRLVQEIACQLKDLRRIPVAEQEQIVV